MTVSLDGKVLTIEAQVAGMPDVLSEGMSLFALNTDGNPATGSLLGAEYLVSLDVKTLEGAVLHWNGTDYVDAEKAADPARSFIGGGAVGFEFNLANFGSPKHVPAKPIAGKKLVFRLAVNRSDNGAPLTTGRMICDPSVAGTVIKHAESFTAGTAKLTFTIPKTAKGKLLKVTVKIVNGSQSATKIVSLRVR